MIREECAQLECRGVARRMWADHADIDTLRVIPDRFKRQYLIGRSEQHHDPPRSVIRPLGINDL